MKLKLYLRKDRPHYRLRRVRSGVEQQSTCERKAPAAFEVLIIWLTTPLRRAEQTENNGKRWFRSTRPASRNLGPGDLVKIDCGAWRAHDTARTSFSVAARPQSTAQGA